MRRREFIAGVGSAVAWPMVARAQQQALPVIGCLYSGPALTPKLKGAFLLGLREQGYGEGRNLTIEYRFADDQYDRLPALASDLVGHRVSVIVSFGLVSSLAAKMATNTIQLVFGIGGDPVKSGLVTSFNRPSGNVTGVAALIEALGPKRLGLVHDMLPRVNTIGVLFNASNPTAQVQVQELETAARSIALAAKIVGIREKGADLDRGFSILLEEGAGALVVVPDPVLTDARERVVALSAQHRLRTIYPVREFAEAGGLMSYGTDFVEAIRQSGAYAGKILRGATPADLPVFQSTKLELVINLMTAKAMALEIPPTILARADEVIE